MTTPIGWRARGVLSQVLGVVALAASTGAAQRAPSVAALSRDLDRFIAAGMRDWEIPGLSVAVVRNDSIVFLRGYGTSRLGADAPVDPNTLFGIMSTTKAMTALTVALLVDDSVLAWDDPVTKWLPEFRLPDPWLTRAVTVRDLLTHRAGLGNADRLWVRGDFSAAEILRRVRYLEPAYSLRSDFVYQNVMYGAAGEVVARAAGIPWTEFVRERVFVPLGMHRTLATARAAVGARDGNVSSPHFRIRDTIRVIGEETVDAIPAAGAVWSTAADMAQWLRFLLDSGRVNGERLVSDLSFRELFAPQVVIRDEFYPTQRLTAPHWTTYGLGWFQQDYRGRFVAFHTGSLDGRIAIVGLLPEERLGVVALGNLDHAEFRHALMLKVFDLHLGAPPRDWSADLLALYGGIRAEADSARRAADALRVAGTAPSLPLAAYVGVYGHPAWGEAEVREEGGGLALRIGTREETRGPLSHWHFDTFRVTWGDGRSPPELVTFALAADGRVASLSLDGVVFARLR